MIDWLIRYADGSTYDSRDGAAWEAPRWGVLRVYFCDERTGVSMEPSPIGHWIWRDGRWVGLDDLSGFYDYLGNHEGPCVVLFGRTLRDDDWERFIVEESKFLTGADKSAWRVRERRT